MTDTERVQVAADCLALAYSQCVGEDGTEVVPSGEALRDALKFAVVAQIMLSKLPGGQGARESLISSAQAEIERRRAHVL